MLFSEANANSTIKGPLFLRKSVFITFSLKLVLTRRMYSISVCAMSSLIEYCSLARWLRSRDIFSPGSEAAGCLGLPPPVSSPSAL